MLSGTKSLALSVHLVDVEPVRSIMEIVTRMVQDDRVPREYRCEISLALLPWLADGKTVDLEQ